MPFLVSRFLLLLTGYLVPLVLPFSYNPDQLIASRGWLFSPLRFVDMWARWDSGWYLTIIADGYRIVENVHTQSNIAFFPLYPIIVKLCLLIVPDSMVTQELTVAIGVVISNIFLLLSLAILYKISLLVFKSAAVANRVTWLMVLFPSSFFLSSFYTESLYLLLSLLSFWFALTKRWKLAVLCASLLGLTRLVGIFILAPLLLLLLLQGQNFKEIKTRSQLMLLALIPSGLLLFFLYLYSITGDFLAGLRVQSAWNKQLADPLQSLLFPTGTWWYITPFDQLVVVAFLISAVQMIANTTNRLLRPFGLYVLLIICPVLFTGTLDSASRYALVAFPVFIYWAWQLEGHPKLDLSIRVSMMLLQMAFFGLYSQFYWAG